MGHKRGPNCSALWQGNPNCSIPATGPLWHWAGRGARANGTQQLGDGGPSTRAHRCTYCCYLHLGHSARRHCANDCSYRLLGPSWGARKQRSAGGALANLQRCLANVSGNIHSSAYVRSPLKPTASAVDEQRDIRAIRLRGNPPSRKSRAIATGFG